MYHFNALIHPIQWTIGLPVGATGPAKRQKKTSCIEYRQDRSGVYIHQVAHRTSFLSRQHDIIASFSFGVWGVWTCFQRETFFELLNKSICFILPLRISTEVSTIMSSPGQKRGTCGHVMPSFDGHMKCARCCDKGIGENSQERL